MAAQVVSFGRLPERDFVTKVGVSCARTAAAEVETTEAILVASEVAEDGPTSLTWAATVSTAVSS